MALVSSSIQFESEKSETDIKKPKITTPITTTIVDSLSSMTLGQLAFDNSEIVSL